MTTLKKIYSDIDLTFTRNPVTGDIAMSYDEQSVIRSIRNLLLTNPYERLFQPSVGSNINAYLFENINAITSSSIETEITTVINNYEPRVKLQSVDVTAVEELNSFHVNIVFFIGNNSSPSQVNILLQRTH